MNKLKAVLIDDEESATNVLKNLLARFCPEIEVMACCNTLEKGVEAIHQYEVELVFLDIEMPNYAGYEIVRFFETINFQIIFVTAYDNYAIKAFELAAIDYLLKPVAISRLKLAVERALEKRNLHEQVKRLALLSSTMEHNSIQNIVVADKGQQHIIAVSDIIAIEANESYCMIYTKERNLIASKNLKHFENILESLNYFFRVHKSWIININYLQNYSKTGLVIQLKNGLNAKLSKYKKAEFESLIL